MKEVYSMSFTVKKEVLGFAPYEAGLSIDEIKEKYNLEQVIKLASNENPLGVSPKVLKVLQEKANYAFRYPQSGAPKLAKKIADYHKVSSSRVVLGNGSDEVIDLLIRVMASPNVHNIVAFDPCFSIYCTQAKLCNVEMRRTPLNNDFSFDFESLYNLIDDKTVVVFLTNPDNPSGYTVKRDEIIQFANRLPKNCLLVVDEAYADFADEECRCDSLLNTQKNIAILRTFSKCYGLAGLRVGYGIFPDEIADYMCRVRLPFALNILAEEAALAALEDKEFYEKTKKITAIGRKFLTDELTKLGCKVCPSQSNFLMVEVPFSGKALFEFLLEKGIILRSLASYGLPNSLRISVGLEEENALLIKYIMEFQGAL